MLLELASCDRVTAVYRTLRAAHAGGRLPGVVELAPAARTMLVSAG